MTKQKLKNSNNPKLQINLPVFLKLGVLDFFRVLRSIRSIGHWSASAGFSLMEVLVAIFLIGTMSLGGMIAYGRVRQQEELLSTVSQIAQLLNLARVRSVSGDNDSTWKVVLTSSTVYLQDDSDTTFEQYALPSGFNLDSGALTQVEFRRASGRVDVCDPECTLTVVRTGSTDTHQLGILYTGVVEY